MLSNQTSTQPNHRAISQHLQASTPPVLGPLDRNQTLHPIPPSPLPKPPRKPIPPPSHRRTPPRRIPPPLPARPRPPLRFRHCQPTRSSRRRHTRKGGRRIWFWRRIDLFELVLVEGGGEARGLAGRRQRRRGWRGRRCEGDHAEFGPEGHEVCASVVFAEDHVLLEAGLVFFGEEDFVVEDAVGVAVGDGGGFFNDGVGAVEGHVGFCFEVEGVDFGPAAGEVVSTAGDEVGELAAVELVVLEGFCNPGGFGEVYVDESVKVE